MAESAGPAAGIATVGIAVVITEPARSWFP